MRFLVRMANNLNSNSQKKRELIDILTRDDQSDALSLGTVKDVASIGSSVISAVHDIFSGRYVFWLQSHPWLELIVL